MPLSSVFEKLKIRRSSNPPSPNSSLKDGGPPRTSSDLRHGHNLDHSRTDLHNSPGRGSMDSPRRSGAHGRGPSTMMATTDEPSHTGYGGVPLVGTGNHIEGQTEVARNLNEQFEHGFHPSSGRSAAVGGGGGAGDHASGLRDGDHVSRSGTGVGVAGGLASPRRTELVGMDERKDLPPIPRGGDVGGHHGLPSTPRKSDSRHTGPTSGEFDADGFPLTTTTTTGSHAHSSSKPTGSNNPESHRHASALASTAGSPTSIPRSQGTFALPTVPQTPAFSEEVQAGLLDRRVGAGAGAGAGVGGLLEQQQQQPGTVGIPSRGSSMIDGPAVMGYVPVHERLEESSRLVDARGINSHSSSRSYECREATVGPFETHHDLTSPRQLAPYPVPDKNLAMQESRQFVTEQSRAVSGATDNSRSPAVHYPAYSATREYTFHPSPPGAEQPSNSHLNHHLQLVQASLFSPQSAGRLRTVGASKPGRYVPLIPGVPVTTDQRDRELVSQREGLVNGIVRVETGRQGAKPVRGLDERSVEVFKRAGWESRVGVLDTVDVRTRVLEPVIQEHVARFETEVFEVMIFRDIHKYHVYPYIQPIHDPSPTILPTRHLFKDAQGQWREIIGDEAAERILGVRIDRSEGKVYQERWIESVSGIEYQTIERESVVAGRRGWVSFVGERLIVGASGVHTGASQYSRNDGMRTSSKPSAIITDAVDDKPRRGSFSATSPGRPVGQRSSRDAPPPPVPSSTAHIGRAL